VLLQESWRGILSISRQRRAPPEPRFCFFVVSSNKGKEEKKAERRCSGALRPWFFYTFEATVTDRGCWPPGPRNQNNTQPHLTIQTEKSAHSPFFFRPF
jgi:hypothetical protein